MCTANVFLVLIAVIFPPLPVWVKRGLCSADSLINIALCLLGFFPGLLHSWYIIFATPDYYDYERVVDIEDGRAIRAQGVSYYYVETPQQHIHHHQQPQAYGTMGGNQNASNAQGRKDVPPTYNEAVQGDNKVQRS